MKNKKILVIEDEKALQAAIKLKLEKSGAEVFSARRVSSALKILKKEGTVDIIWLDHYLLGKESGMDFVMAVKANKKWNKIPIFVVSNTATHDKVQSYLKLGVHKYYTKSNLKLDNIVQEIMLLK
jgi:two-component system chemotaxis response regulator CheY